MYAERLTMTISLNLISCVELSVEYLSSVFKIKFWVYWYTGSCNAAYNIYGLIQIRGDNRNFAYRKKLLYVDLCRFDVIAMVTEIVPVDK